VRLQCLGDHHGCQVLSLLTPMNMQLEVWVTTQLSVTALMNAEGKANTC
jgi:hypothetical protein